MAIPDTYFFTLQNVQTELGQNNLVSAFAAALSANFDAAYSGSKNALMCFRNYHTPAVTGIVMSATTYQDVMTWDLSWTAGNGGPYEVWRSINGAAFSKFQIIPAGTTTFSNTSLIGTRSYMYKITDDAGTTFSNIQGGTPGTML